MKVNIKNLNYNKYCKHCKYMKRHGAYTQDLFESKYFEKNGQLSLPETMKKYQVDIPVQTIYNCLKRHHHNYTDKPDFILNGKGELITATEKLISQPSEGERVHEMGLDEFINQGREMVARGEIAITASNYITAIKVKAEIEKSNKDRKLDLLKTMFSGAAPETSNET